MGSGTAEKEEMIEDGMNKITQSREFIHFEAFLNAF